jgi:hypothetical protein
MKMREQDAPACQCINVWCFNLSTITSQVGVPQIVRHNHQNVGPRVSSRLGERSFWFNANEGNNKYRSYIIIHLRCVDCLKDCLTIYAIPISPDPF